MNNIFDEEYTKPQLEIANAIYTYLTKNYTVKIVDTPTFETNSGVLQVLTRKLNGLDYNSIIEELDKELKGTEILYLYKFGIIQGVLRSWLKIRFNCTKDNIEKELVGSVKINDMFPSLDMLKEYIDSGISTISYKDSLYNISKYKNSINIELQ